MTKKQAEEPTGSPRDPIPPGRPVYLDRGYGSSVRGGTAIVAQVCDREEHARRMTEPDGYRPPCRCCGGPMHSHGTSERRPRHELPLQIRRYTCPRCGGVVQVLPGFLARNYWWPWEAIEATCEPSPEPASTAVSARVSVPARTERRWRARLRERAARVLHVLSASGRPELREMVAAVGLGAARWEVLRVFRPLALRLGVFASLAFLLNLLDPGLRMM
jgi:hypothetical protein